MGWMRSRVVQSLAPNLAAEDTYGGGGGEDEVRGRHKDDVKEVAAAKCFVSGIDVS